MDQTEVRRALAAADAAYTPFAPFSEWVSEPVGLGSWDDAASHLAAVRAAASVDEVDAALDEVLRAAAVDTGALEGLYRADRGFTLSVARNVISLDQAEVEAGLGFRRSFEAQLAGFELAVQLATGDEVITEAAVREVHRVTCADDSTYRVLTEHGIQERQLVLGAYKSEPNHVQLADGGFHSYAPVDQVVPEMHRLVEELRSAEFTSAPAVVQAAFAHHAFTSIHPFPDGNGRVARLLASVFLVRSASIPLWIEVSDRAAYLDALGAADRGDRQPFLRYLTRTSLRLLRELALQVETPSDPPVDHLDLAAASAAEALAGRLGAALGSVPTAYVQFPVGPPLDLLAGVVVPEGASLFVSGAPAFVRDLPVAVGVRRSGSPSERFVVLVLGDTAGPADVERADWFDESELVGSIDPVASRRLDQLVKIVVAMTSGAPQR